MPPKRKTSSVKTEVATKKQKTDKSGKTFPQYLGFLRINEAKRILLTKDFKTVAEVGYTVGFNSSSNFIRVFKSQEGQSPKSFAEENAN